MSRCWATSRRAGIHHAEQLKQPPSLQISPFLLSLFPYVQSMTLYGLKYPIAHLGSPVPSVSPPNLPSTLKSVAIRKAEKALSVQFYSAIAKTSLCYHTCAQNKPKTPDTGKKSPFAPAKTSTSPSSDRAGTRWSPSFQPPGSPFGDFPQCCRGTVLLCQPFGNTIQEKFCTKKVMKHISLTSKLLGLCVDEKMITP